MGAESTNYDEEIFLEHHGKYLGGIIRHDARGPVGRVLNGAIYIFKGVNRGC